MRYTLLVLIKWLVSVHFTASGLNMSACRWHCADLCSNQWFFDSRLSFYRFPTSLVVHSVSCQTQTRLCQCHFCSFLFHFFLPPTTTPLSKSKWTSAGRLHHVFMPTCVTLLPCSWLISYLCWKAARRTLLLRRHDSPQSHFFFSAETPPHTLPAPRGFRQPCTRPEVRVRGRSHPLLFWFTWRSPVALHGQPHNTGTHSETQTCAVLYCTVLQCSHSLVRKV